MQMFIILFCIMDVWKISYFKTLTDIQQVSTDYHVLSPVLGIGLGSRRGPKEPWPCLQELEIYSETTQQLPGKKNTRQTGRMRRQVGEARVEERHQQPVAQKFRGYRMAGRRGRGPSRRQGAELSSGDPREGELTEKRCSHGKPTWQQECSSASSVQFSCNPVDCSTPGFPVHPQLPEFTQSHVDWVSDAVQPSHPLSSPSPPAFNLSQHQGLFKWASSSHQVAKVLEFQL